MSEAALPIEIWQKIFGFCDDVSVKTIDENFPYLLDSKNPVWKKECWRMRKTLSIPDVIFTSEVVAKVNFLQILIQRSFMGNLISSSKMFTENIIALHNSPTRVSYQTHDISNQGVITFRFPLEKLGFSDELLDGSFLFCCDYNIYSQLDRFVHLEMKTLIRSIDDGYFYGDEKEDFVDSQTSLHRLRPFYHTTFTTIYSSTAHAKNPVEDQELYIRMQIPYGVTITDIRLI
ncbi:hypothetical protein PENTCL1PPCAC_2493 [Pristionchus entomophagus]|uniref:F-box domain-containing protein n=1 Tax=Pristionchus entomophagus TaxID=358040 RepID=A0AAV5SDN9_9BILA|nr:hypothetical protein PENTCL1PPCAC_2493 [Pristionchus entomophagus]